MCGQRGQRREGEAGGVQLAAESPYGQPGADPCRARRARRSRAAPAASATVTWSPSVSAESLNAVPGAQRPDPLGGGDHGGELFQAARTVEPGGAIGVGARPVRPTFGRRGAGAVPAGRVTRTGRGGCVVHRRSVARSAHVHGASQIAHGLLGQVVDGPPAQVPGLGRDDRLGARRGRPRGTARRSAGWARQRAGDRVHVQLDRHRRSIASPAMPDSSVASRSAAAASGAVAGLAVAAELHPRPTRGCRVSRRAVPSAESTNALRGEVAGNALRAVASGPGGEQAQVRLAQRWPAHRPAASQLSAGSRTASACSATWPGEPTAAQARPRRPCSIARSVPSRNRSSCVRPDQRPAAAAQRIGSAPDRRPGGRVGAGVAGEPGRSGRARTATGTPDSLPFTRSAAAASSSPTATWVTTSSLPYRPDRPGGRPAPRMPGGADGDVGDPHPPGPALGVGDHHADPPAACRRTPRPGRPRKRPDPRAAGRSRRRARWRRRCRRPRRRCPSRFSHHLGPARPGRPTARSARRSACGATHPAPPGRKATAPARPRPWTRTLEVTTSTSPSPIHGAARMIAAARSSPGRNVGEPGDRHGPREQARSGAAASTRSVGPAASEDGQRRHRRAPAPPRPWRRSRRGRSSAAVRCPTANPAPRPRRPRPPGTRPAGRRSDRAP